MVWCRILHGCVILMNLFIFSDGCQIQPTEKSNVQCDTCLEEQYSVEVCSQATGRNHRLNNFTVLSSNTQVLSREFVNNRTVIKLDISKEYSEYRRGYLFIFLMYDDDRLLCKSTLFPRCRAQLASLALSVSGRISAGPEIHQLLDVRAVTEDWISEITTSGSNSSYLKISFDVKSRDVKWYAVELWDNKNNLIKADKTEMNYIVFMNVTKGIYYAVMMEGSQCPCSINIPGHRQCVTCTAKKSDLFTYPIKKDANVRQKSNIDPLLVALICGGFAAVAGILIGVVLMKKKIKKLIKCFWTGSNSSVSMTIVTTNQCQDSAKMLRKIIRTKFNIESKHLTFSPKNMAKVYNFASNIFIVIISKYDLTNYSIQCNDLYQNFNQSSKGKSVVFAVIDDANYKETPETNHPTSVPRHLMFNISSNLDFLVEFLAMKIHNSDWELLQNTNQTGSKEVKENELVLSCSNIFMSQQSDSISKVLDTRKFPRAPADAYQIVETSRESEVMESISFRSFFIPPDDDSDSAYKTQSECMKTINDAYDAYRREENAFSSPDIEAISLGERSV